MASEGTKTGLTLGASVLTGLTLLALISPFLFAARNHTPFTVTLAPQDRNDRPDFHVLAANFTPELVQLGTQQPFLGHGAPGLILRIIGLSNYGDLSRWTLNGWANETVPPVFSTCHSQSIFFDQVDWTYQASDLDSNVGYFTSKPTTIPERLGTDGDQCLPRAGAVGPWKVTVCVEGVGPDDGGKGPPRGIYDGADGNRHKDGWDRCDSKTVIVPSSLVLA